MDLGKEFSDPIKVYEDNTSAIKLASNQECKSRTKHIATRHHFVRELVQNRTIEISYMESKYNIADILTKPMGPQRQEFLVERMNLTKGSFIRIQE